MFVLAIGALCLAYSMYTFFSSRPRGLPARAARPAPAQTQPTEAPAPVKFAARTEPVSYSPEWLAQQNEFAQKTARAHLANVGLSMKLPDNVQFGENNDGPVSVLMGATAAGKVGLYLFTLPNKPSAEKARAYFEDFFKYDLRLKPSGKGSPYTSRKGVEMTFFKGRTESGDEYQAFFFKNRNRGHVLFLTDKALSRHPAAVKSIVDSIQAAR